ncbi:LysR substrate-binding domain-containing protein [Leisingera sp. ANG-M1]|uniref:LysR substrate-binding domain-containing protein n=1 Tax=Leisingera sp. ANG-M1 TaxID=1577895 RepID=UPI000A9B38E2|nr:LysR substrate-binding domain-containing protein [Leisingera sp. ANG-M1]
MHYWKTIPPLKALLAVEAVARLRSFTRAGEELNTSQSAVSHAVTQAESFLETKLFDRSARPVALTAEGTEYIASLSTCLAQLSADTQALRQRKEDNTLTISCNLAYGNYWLLPRLKGFHAAHPGVQVNMVTAFHGLSTLDPGIDVAIRFGRGSWPGCQSQLLFREQILPVASPGYIAQTGAASSPQDLLRHTLLHARSNDKSWYDWTQWFSYFGVRQSGPLPGPAFDNHLLMMQAALSGRGIALGWIGTATDFLQEGQLVPVLNTPVVLEEGLYAVARDRSSPRINAFLEWFANYTATEFRGQTQAHWPGLAAPLPRD